MTEQPAYSFPKTPRPISAKRGTSQIRRPHNNPGPSDYHPVVSDRATSFSIRKRPELIVTDCSPGPAAYNFPNPAAATPRAVIGRDSRRLFTSSERTGKRDNSGKHEPAGILPCECTKEAYAVVTIQNTPGAYKVPPPKDSVSYTILKRPIDQPNKGPGPGAYSPGNNSSKQGPRAVFGSSKRLQATSTRTPGAGAYRISRRLGKQGYSFARSKRYSSRHEAGPGPGSYSTKSSIGRQSLIKS